MTYRTGGLHKIADLQLLACYSADSALRDVQDGISTATWRSNVALNGRFRGFIGEVTDDSYLDLMYVEP